MKILSWNIRGLGKRSAYRALKKLLADFGPDIVFLMETKIKRKRLERHRHALGFKEGYYWDPDGIAGGLALWRREGVELQVLDSTKHYFDTKISGEEVKDFFCSFCYGSPYIEAKEEVFESFKALRPNSEAPWCLMGDFNDIRSQEEKLGGPLADKRRMEVFNDWIYDCNLLDLPIQGGDLTWSNNRVGKAYVAERLDRVLFNPSWNLKFPFISGLVDAAVELDHKSIILFLEK